MPVHRSFDETGVVTRFDDIVLSTVYILEMQVVLLGVYLSHGDRGMADLPCSYVECLHPVVWPILFDDEHPLESHMDMMLRLDMTVVKHGAGLPGSHLERAVRSGHHFAVAGVESRVA